MKVKVLRPFTMGAKSYKQDSEPEFDYAISKRLVGEGLVSIVNTNPSVAIVSHEQNKNKQNLNKSGGIHK